MLDIAHIIKEYPPLEQPFRRNMLREYLQYKILDSIFRTRYASKLAFLGGTALRIVHRNTRFSEDLDFDNFGLTYEEFDSLAQLVRTGLELEGYEVELKNVHKGAYRSYIRIPKVLYAQGLSAQEEEKILIQIDTVPHAFAYVPDTVLLNKFDVFTQIFVTPLDVLLSQKMYASVSRKRAKGRDFYDIVFLLGRTKPNYAYLAAKLGVSNANALRAMLLARTESFDFDALADDVAPFVIGAHAEDRVRLFREFIAKAEL